MRRTFLAGLALISLAACGGGAKKQPAVAKAKPPAVRPHTTKKATAHARKPSRKTPASVDTTTQFNPLQNH